MLPMKVNSETGFLEGNASNAFDSERKIKFIEQARKIREAGGWPSINSLCKAIGISERTFGVHLQVDAVFKETWEDIVHGAADALESKMFEYAQGKGGYMHMITWLRANRPGKWNPDLKVIVNADSPALKSVTNLAKDAIEADIVDDSKQIEGKHA